MLGTTAAYSDSQCRLAHHRIGGVAVRAEVAGIGDEDLINDVSAPTKKMMGMAYCRMSLLTRSVPKN